MIRQLMRPLFLAIALAVLAQVAISQQTPAIAPKPATTPGTARARGFAALNERLRGEPAKEPTGKQLLARASQPPPAPIKISPEGDRGGPPSDHQSDHLGEADLEMLMQLGLLIDPVMAAAMVPRLQPGHQEDKRTAATEIPAAPFPPETLQKMLIVGDLAFRKGLMPRALTAYERAASMQPDSVACQLAIAEASIAARQFQRAADLVQLALRRSPSSMRVMIDRAGLYSSAAQLQAAELDLRQYVLDHREDGKAVLLLGYVLVSDGKDAAEARLVVRAAGEMLGDDPAVSVLKKKLGTAPAEPTR